MAKLPPHKHLLIQQRLALLREHFPDCVSETLNAQGDPQLMLDIAALKQELAGVVVEGQERYQLLWPGKEAAQREAHQIVQARLQLNAQKSLHPHTTQNLFIEGDNLDALKLLQDEYCGRVKMIYIDPPYNTGQDFVYCDNYCERTSDFRKRCGELNGRFHCAWLSMIYPRLQLARTLLREDGVIFISIDDGESHNLRKVADEIFGEKNFIAQICHKTRASISNDKIISSSHNLILLYAKSIDAVFSQRHLIGLDPDLSRFANPDNDPRGPWRLTPVDGPGGARKGNPCYAFLGVEGYFRYSKASMEQKHREGLIVKNTRGLQQKYFLSSALQSRKTATTWWDDVGLAASATRKLQALMGAKVFETPKPVELIYRMLKLMTWSDKEEAIVLDFFAGSGTTAHAVMQINAEDGGNRRFILVQIPTPCDAKSEAYKAGYATIADIAQERIRRAGALIVQGKHHANWRQDTGFKVMEVVPLNT